MLNVYLSVISTMSGRSASSIFRMIESGYMYCHGIITRYRLSNTGDCLAGT